MNENLPALFITAMTAAIQSVCEKNIALEMKRRSDDRDCNIRSGLKKIMKFDTLSLLLCQKLNTQPSTLSSYYTPGRPEFDIALRRCTELLDDMSDIPDTMDFLVASVLSRTGFPEYTNCIEWGETEEEIFKDPRIKALDLPECTCDTDSCCRLVKTFTWLTLRTLEQRCGEWQYQAGKLRSIFGLEAPPVPSIEPDEPDRVSKLFSVFEMIGDRDPVEISRIYTVHRAAGRYLLNPANYTKLISYLERGVKIVVIMNDVQAAEPVAKHINIGTFLYTKHSALIEKWKELTEKYSCLRVMTTSLPILHSIDYVKYKKKEKSEMLINLYAYGQPDTDKYQRSLFRYGDRFYDYYVEELSYIISHSDPV